MNYGWLVGLHVAIGRILPPSCVGMGILACYVRFVAASCSGRVSLGGTCSISSLVSASFIRLVQDFRFPCLHTKVEIWVHDHELSKKNSIIKLTLIVYHTVFSIALCRPTNKMGKTYNGFFSCWEQWALLLIGIIFKQKRCPQVNCIDNYSPN